MILLSLAAQHGRVEVIELFLIHWKTCVDGRPRLIPGTTSLEYRVLKANADSRWHGVLYAILSIYFVVYSKGMSAGCVTEFLIECCLW